MVDGINRWKTGTGLFLRAPNPKTESFSLRLFVHPTNIVLSLGVFPASTGFPALLSSFVINNTDEIKNIVLLYLVDRKIFKAFPQGSGSY